MVDVVEQAYTEPATPMNWDRALLRFPSISSCMAVCIRPKSPHGALVGLHLGLFMGPLLGGDMIASGDVTRYLNDLFKLCGTKGYGASAVMLMGMWDVWSNNPSASRALQNGVSVYAKSQGLATYNFYDSSAHNFLNIEITPGAATYGIIANTYDTTPMPFVATAT